MYIVCISAILLCAGVAGSEFCLHPMGLTVRYQYEKEVPGRGRYSLCLP